MLKDFQYEWLRLSMTEDKFISLLSLPEPLLESIYSDVTKYGPNGEQVTVLAERIISNLKGVTFNELSSNPTWSSLVGLWEKDIEMHAVGVFFESLEKEISPAAFAMANILALKDSVCKALVQVIGVPIPFDVQDSVVMLLWFTANGGGQLYPQTRRLKKIEEVSLNAIAVINQ